MKSSYISLPVLVGFMIVAVDSARNLPSLAIFGHYLPVFFILGMALFLIPVLFVSAELSAVFSNDTHNGVYHWVRNAFGKDIGMFAVWAQWSNSAIWFPANLIFIVSTFIAIFVPWLSHNQIVMAFAMSGLFWIITYINTKGVKESASVAFMCMLGGVVIPVLFLVVIFAMWYFYGYTMHIAITAESFTFAFNLDNLSAITAIIASFLGMELCSVHINQVRSPRKTYTKAIWTAGTLVVLMYFAGAMAIAFMIPHNDINIYDGIAGTFKAIFSRFNISYLTPVLILMIVAGSIGSLINWSVSPVKGMAQAAQHGYLPEALGRENRHGAPGNILIAQAVVITAMCFIITLFDSISDFYWVFLSLSTEIYLMMYMLLFLSAIRIRRNPKFEHGVIIRSNLLFYTVISLGIIGSILAFIIGFIPSASVIHGLNIGTFELIYAGTTIGVCLFYFVFYFYHRRPQKS